MSASQGSSTAPPQTSCAASGQWLLATAGTANSLPLIMEHNQQCLETVQKGTTARSLEGEARHEAREKQHCSTLQQVPVSLHKTDNGAAGGQEALPSITDPGELTASLSAPSSGNGSSERLSTLSNVTQLLTLRALISATDYNHSSSTPKTHHTTALTPPHTFYKLPTPPLGLCEGAMNAVCRLTTVTTILPQPHPRAAWLLCLEMTLHTAQSD